MKVLSSFRSLFESIWIYWQRSIRRQMMFGFGATALMIMAATGYVLHDQQRDALYREGIRHATTLANALAKSSSSWMLENDVVGLQEAMSGLSGTADFKRAFVLAPNGEVLASTHPEEIGLFVSDTISRNLLKAVPEMHVLLDQQNLVDVAMPVMAGSHYIGWVRVELTRESANADLLRLDQIWLSFALLAVLLVTLVSLLLSRALTKGLNQLMSVTDKVARGNREARANIERNDEVGVLAHDFNAMLDTLHESDLRFRQLAENISEVFWMTEPDKHKMLYVSPAYELIWGRSVQSLIDSPRSWLDCIQPDDRQRVTEASAKQAEGLYDEEFRIVRSDGEIRWIHDRAFPILDSKGRVYRIVGIAEDVTERKQIEEHVQRLAHFDQLTGLPNRALFSDRFKYAFSMAKRSHAQLAILFLDLDHFKNINDTIGHHIGDRLLIEVAKRLESAVREGDTVSRQGGDEFILLLQGTGADGAAHVAEKLLETVAHLYQIEQYELNVTCSIGIAMYPGNGEDFETLYKCVDVAMYRAKHDGRNNYRFFTAEMQTHSARTLQLESALRHALQRDQLRLHYQPQVSLQDGRIIGAEALLRWQHPELGSVSPAEFIPIAESSGQILKIGEWVLRTAARQMKSWMDSGLGQMTIAVNLSAVQFRHPHLPELVMQILEEAKLSPQYLELELTEGVAMHDPLGAIAVMDSLHERGIRMSIDDFGTGYSSLSYLKRFKVYKLKIDQTFVRDITDDPEDRAIVSAIISLANSLGLQTIAEGVETEGQLAFLREQGCNEVQGYYFSKPLPAEQFEAFVRDKSKV